VGFREDILSDVLGVSGRALKVRVKELRFSFDVNAT